ncbi:uncharacterized protein A1O5_12137 [Cladophialophora psammophila CBS 110553]|uniref:HNH nuclease domain-containing protein n=1 Tax=Cladophialophora psammophila CBS 110553 TaxID=1182543 RepID=W9VUV6_9EURO|nr:uncharacterized protein A1O5_12137 [Cladophialophora psammophila CBS 110553]EXJ59512.1 hypothetical protein A1O5_12137 [Cladophialophora psammophila CBS 110553]
MASNEDKDRITWSPYGPPSHPEKPQERPAHRHIHFKHPGCDTTLFTLPPLDAGGIHHETVRIACGILDNNTWDDLNYAVTPTFEHWCFPYGDLPPRWREIPDFQQKSRPDRDSACRISQCEEGVEDAHLVPSAERQWFNNNMAVYIHSAKADKLKESDNSIRLRSDIHTIFDAKRFAIVPIEGRLVVYCMNTNLGSQVEGLYHGVEIHRIRNSGFLSQFLFARFAYTVFERLRAFLEANTTRKLRLRVDHEPKEEMCSPERCLRLASDTAYQGKSRSVSPKKRPRPDTEPNDDNWSETDFRGRKRRRSDDTESFSVSLPSSVGYSADLLIGTPGTPPTPAPKTENTTDIRFDLKTERHQSNPQNEQALS